MPVPVNLPCPSKFTWCLSKPSVGKPAKASVSTQFVAAKDLRVGDCSATASEDVARAPFETRQVSSLGSCLQHVPGSSCSGHCLAPTRAPPRGQRGNPGLPGSGKNMFAHATWMVQLHVRPFPQPLAECTNPSNKNQRAT